MTVRDRSGAPVFESGAITPEGMIQGNDSDADPKRYEPHYSEISRPDEVEIYESVMGDSTGTPTTGLLSAVKYLKDNRLLPRGFEKSTAEADVAVVGNAAQDEDFTSGGDRVRYAIDVVGHAGPFQIDVELCVSLASERQHGIRSAFDAAVNQSREVNAEKRELRIGNGVNQIATQVPGIRLEFVVLAAKGDDLGVRLRAAELGDAVAVQTGTRHDAASFDIARRTLQDHPGV